MRTLWIRTADCRNQRYADLALGHRACTAAIIPTLPFEWITHEVWWRCPLIQTLQWTKQLSDHVTVETRLSTSANLNKHEPSAGSPWRAFSITPSKVGQFFKFSLTSWLTHLYCTVSVTHRTLPKGQRSGRFDDVSCCRAAACCLHRCLYHTRCWSGLFTTDNWSLSRDLWPGPCGLFFLKLTHVIWMQAIFLRCSD